MQGNTISPSNNGCQKGSENASYSTIDSGSDGGKCDNEGDEFINIECETIVEEVSQEPNDIVKCRGVCGGRAFHINCLPDEYNPENVKTTLEKWKCPECSTGKHKCNLCGEHGETPPIKVFMEKLNF